MFAWPQPAAQGDQTASAGEAELVQKNEALEAELMKKDQEITTLRFKLNNALADQVGRRRLMPPRPRDAWCYPLSTRASALGSYPPLHLFQSDFDGPVPAAAQREIAR